MGLRWWNLRGRDRVSREEQPKQKEFSYERPFSNFVVSNSFMKSRMSTYRPKFRRVEVASITGAVPDPGFDTPTRASQPESRDRSPDVRRVNCSAPCKAGIPVQRLARSHQRCAI